MIYLLNIYIYYFTYYIYTLYNITLFIHTLIPHFLAPILKYRLTLLLRLLARGLFKLEGASKSPISKANRDFKIGAKKWGVKLQQKKLISMIII